MLRSAVRGFKTLGRICSQHNSASLKKSLITSMMASTRHYSDRPTDKPDPRLKFEDDIDDGDDDDAADFDVGDEHDEHEAPIVKGTPHVSQTEHSRDGTRSPREGKNTVERQDRREGVREDRRDDRRDNRSDMQGRTGDRRDRTDRRDDRRDRPQRSGDRPEREDRDRRGVYSDNRVARDQWYASSNQRTSKKPEIEEREGDIRKRKVAIWFGYVGSNYKGSQKNPTVSTIEGELENALFKAGLVKEANFGDLRKMRWSRSSRTDRGVHAIKAIVGCKVEANFKRVRLQGEHNYVYRDKEQCLALPGLVNAHLPPHIRVLAVRPVKKAFNARGMCNRRYYDYLIPKSFLNNTLYTDDKKSFKEVLRLFEGMYNWHNFTSLTRVMTERKQLQHTRIVEILEPEEKPALLPFPLALSREEQAENFAPTHSLFRLVETVDCDEVKIADMEYVRIKVIGQSFVTHQIRKMVALILLAAHRVVPKDIVSIVIRGPLSFKIPLAPPEGLVLRECDFYNFSRKEPIHVFDLEPSEQRNIDTFRDSVLLPHIHNELSEKKSFDEFLAAIPAFVIDDTEEVRRVFKEWHEGGEAVRQSKKIRRAAVAMLRGVFHVLQDERDAKNGVHYNANSNKSF